MARYGTSFETLEDEDGPVKKRPKHVHEEVVTDEKGRRRFHGAFTGGFSAGFFNTVGSKHGWVPQTFKSSRDNRATAMQYKPEDFMDEEDLGEFGIAKRDFHVNKKYTKNKPDQLGLAVWDRPSKVSNVFDDLFKISKGEQSQSIGLKIMKKMGYREGKGIGAPLTRKQLELQRLNESRAFNRKSRFDKSAVEEAEEYAKGFMFIPEDIPPVYFTHKENDHGLGYQPLKGLTGGYRSIPKVDEKNKRGEAFGVGVFEDSDDDVYGIEDMSKYSFELGGLDVDPMSRMNKRTINSDVYNVEFVQAKKPRKKPPHLTITVPPHFNPKHIPISFDASKLPSNIKDYGRNMSVIQRAMILGENNVSIMDMLSYEDREKLRQARRIADDNANKKKKEAVKPKEYRDPFIDTDEEKSYRFQKYLECLRRGVPCGKPSGMPIEQWRVEEEEFQKAVPQELRHLLPDIQERKQPLYKGDFAQALMNKLKSRFVSNEELDQTSTKEPQKKIEPFVKMEWHPAKRLCKRVNVPDPFPYSQIEGIPGVESKIKIKKDFTTTEIENEIAMRGPAPLEQEKTVLKKVEDTTEPDPLFEFFGLMNEVFGTTEKEIKEGEKIEEEAIKEEERLKKEREKEEKLRKEREGIEEKKVVREKSPPKQQQQYKSLFDLIEDDKTKKKDEKKKVKKEKYSDSEEDESSDSSSDSSRDERVKKKKKKKRKKEKEKHKSKKKERKHKKKHKKESSRKKEKKKHKSRRRSSSDSDSIIHLD